ncbi:MAG: Bax inhibitor-1/YccA family protein [Chthoniobacteraceae bacterium]
MTGNPTLNQNTFTDVRGATGQEAMTVQGTVNKASILLILVTLAASYTWHMMATGDTQNASMWITGGAIAGFVFAMITIFKKDWSAVTAPIYAICEGLFIGALSAMFEKMYPGIVLRAVMLTFGTLAALLFAYKTRLIVASDNFKRGIVAATGGIFLLYMATWILSFFHVNVSFLYGNSMLSIGISLFVVVIAALNLVLDFDFIEQGARAGAPKYMEWYGAFGLLVTLVWLYLEILRLLSKLNRRD